MGYKNNTVDDTLVEDYMTITTVNMILQLRSLFGQTRRISFVQISSKKEKKA
jgi:hypothetical protein